MSSAGRFHFLLSECHYAFEPDSRTWFAFRHESNLLSLQTEFLFLSIAFDIVFCLDSFFGFSYFFAHAFFRQKKCGRCVAYIVQITRSLSGLIQIVYITFCCHHSEFGGCIFLADFIFQYIFSRASVFCVEKVESIVCQLLNPIF